MRKFTLKISSDFEARDIKFILQNHYRLSSGLITRLKKGSGITLNGEKAYVTKQVKGGDVLTVTIPEKNSENIVPNNIPLDILYEDEDILAVNKPYNMPTHPSIGHFENTLANAVAYYYRDIPFTFRAVTRLDRDTSGIVLIAKNSLACDMLSRGMRQQHFYKEYLAVCVGVPFPKSGRINAPIARSSEGIIKRCVIESGKEAISDYAVIDEFNSLSLLRLVPRTGRTHQLRVHLAHLGTPIFGDFLYGTPIENERLRLHCRRLNFLHPVTRQKMDIIAAVPPDMDIRKIKR